MTPIERCLSEIAQCIATEGHPAWQVAIGHADWAAEMWMIEREAA